MNTITTRKIAQLVILAGFIGVSMTAHGASKKISEADACDMAKAEVLKRQGGENKREVKILGCAQFSTLDIGVGKIQVLYDTSYYNEYMKTRYETKNMTDSCNFIQASDGWKLVRCK